MTIKSQGDQELAGCLGFFGLGLLFLGFGVWFGWGPTLLFSGVAAMVLFVLILK